MLPYYLLFLPFAFLALTRSLRFNGWNIFFTFLSLFFFIGFRFNTGGDWTSYLRMVRDSYEVPFHEIFSTSTVEPLYDFLNWIGANQFGGLVFVNCVCALIFCFSLLRFCGSQPRPWLSLLISIPYLVIVVSMGYTRQSVAIAFELLGFLALESGMTIRFIIFIILGSLFHKSALVLLLFCTITNQEFFIRIPPRIAKLFKTLLIIVSAYGFYITNRTDIVGFIYGYYGDYYDYSPQGAFIRLFLTTIFAILFLYLRNSFDLPDSSNRIWTVMSIFTLLASTCLLLGILPVIVDRLALYLLPLQLVVASHLPEARFLGFSSSTINSSLVVFSFFFLYIWLNYATNVRAWIPYQNFLF